MTTPTQHPTPQPDSATRPSRGPQASTPSYGAATFGGMLMLLAGTLHLVQGLVALVNDEFYVSRQAQMVELDLVTWGWIHLVFGVLVASTGAALVAGRYGARIPAVLLVALSVVVNAIWFAHYPFWSATVIALDVFVIWALIAQREAGAGHEASRSAR